MLCKSYLKPHSSFKPVADHHAAVQFPPGSMPPGAVPKAYGFLANLGTPKKQVAIGIGSLGGSVVMSDVQAFCAAGNFPMPNITVLPVGGVTPTSDPGGANVENQLDIQCVIEAWNTAYPNVPATIIFAIGPNDENGMQLVTAALRQAGCAVISWSWGAPDVAGSSRAGMESELAECKSAGIIVVCASGDNSVDDGTNAPICDYLAGSGYVWSVGGTSLTLNASGGIASEKAWGDGLPGDEGGGGGYDALTPMPAWQNGIVPPGRGRGCPDSSLNADPDTGYQRIADGEWGVVGGTSASTPETAAYFAVLLSQGANPADFQTILYAARSSAFRDILLGSNGDPAAAGWDPATGLGSINGGGLAAALNVGVGAPPVTPPPVKPPVNPPPVKPPVNPPVEPPPSWIVYLTVQEVVFELEYVLGWPAARIRKLLPTIKQKASAGESAQQILTDVLAHVAQQEAIGAM